MNFDAQGQQSLNSGDISANFYLGTMFNLNDPGDFVSNTDLFLTQYERTNEPSNSNWNFDDINAVAEKFVNYVDQTYMNNVGHDLTAGNELTAAVGVGWMIYDWAKDASTEIAKAVTKGTAGALDDFLNNPALLDPAVIGEPPLE